jgi:hypothetical protein
MSAILAFEALKIRAAAVGFPIAVTRRLEAFGPADLALARRFRVRPEPGLGLGRRLIRIRIGFAIGHGFNMVSPILVR